MNTVAAICDTVLENPQKITVAGRVFSVHPPKVSTLIEASKYMSTLPKFDVPKKESDKVYFAIKHAKECDTLGDICAILILGKNNLITTKTTVIKQKNRFGRGKEVEVTETINNQKELAQCLNDELNSEELFELAGSLIGIQRVGFFLNTMDLMNKVATVT